MNRKQVVKSRCANYVNGMCVVRDIPCPLVTPFEYNGHKFPCEEAECLYFEKNVVGIDGVKEVQLYSFKACKQCDRTFKPTSSASVYCSDSCRILTRKKSHRKFNSKRQFNLS
jgi:hypothetical protein